MSGSFTIPYWTAQSYLFFFGLISVGGGVMGWVKAQSLASLIAGGISGGLLLLAGVLMWTHLGAAGLLALVVSMALLGRFVPALARGKRMPALYMVPLAAVGALVGIMLLIARWG